MNFGEIVYSSIPNPEQYVVGYADMQGLLEAAYHPYRYAIVFGRKLDDEIVQSIESGPNQQYFAHYHSLNRELSSLLVTLSKRFKKVGINTRAIVPTVLEGELPTDYLKTLRYNFSHKMVATRAGIGWIGKTSLLVTRKFGPRVRLATLLVDYAIPNVGIPITQAECGHCFLCVNACPAQAASGLTWEVGIMRDEFFNAFKCREKCRQLSIQSIGEHISLCGICIAICPVGA